jgi:hypothetical protein
MADDKIYVFGGEDGTIPTSPLNPSPLPDRPTASPQGEQAGYQGEGNRERLISLKVYDVLENEIATLLNEEKSIGCYEVEFDAETLPSGVYLYRLQAVPISRQAGSFVKTRKMILVK